METSGNAIRVGVVGLGRSGWGIHTDAFGRMGDLYKVVAMHDPLSERLAASAAAVGATPHGTLAGLLADENVDMVVVASPNKFHYEQAVAALKAGKHVLCDKPFGRTVAEVDDMIATAKQMGKVLQPFQQRRYELDFREVLRVMASGVLGEVQAIRICWHGFKRRWDWQTIPEMGAGELYNNGPHPIDHALLLMGDSDATPVEPEVWCERRRGLCSGAGEDHVKLILSAPGKPTVDIEISSVVAYGHDRWLVAGTGGGLKGSANALDWKWVDWSGMPPRPVDPKSTPDRTYNSEVLTWKTGSWSAPSQADTGGGATPAAQPILDLYKDLYATLRNAKPQVITPQSVRRRVAILEKAAKMAPVRNG